MPGLDDSRSEEDTKPLGGCWLLLPGACSSGFFFCFFRTSPVMSLACWLASSRRCFCCEAVSPRMAPRMPLSGVAPSRAPVPRGSLMETGGWRSSISCCWGFLSGLLARK